MLGLAARLQPGAVVRTAREPRGVTAGEGLGARRGLQVRGRAGGEGVRGGVGSSVGTVGEPWALRAALVAGGLGSPAVSRPQGARASAHLPSRYSRRQKGRPGGHCRALGRCVGPRPPASLAGRPEWGSGARAPPPGDGGGERGRRRQDPGVPEVPRRRPLFWSTAGRRGGRSRVYTRCPCVTPRVRVCRCVRVRAGPFQARGK